MNSIMLEIYGATAFAPGLFLSSQPLFLFILWLVLILVVLCIGIIYLLYRFGKPDRRYSGRSSVSWIYDDWSEDRMLEHYWGGHLHAGYYGQPPVKKPFIRAKNDLIDAMIDWALPDTEANLMSRLESESEGPVRILDVGCGLGATMRHLGKRWPETAQITGITLSESQARRGAALTEHSGLRGLSFLQGDVLFQTFPDDCFDIVWSLECEPHIHDKRRFAEEMMRVLKPGGLLLMGTWNLRETNGAPLTKLEAQHIGYLLDEWNHAEFISISAWEQLFEWLGLKSVDSVDWRAETLPSWRQAVIVPWLRPGVFILSLLTRFKRIMRDGVTLLRFDRAFRQGLMAYGIFRGQKPVSVEDEAGS